MENDSTGGNGEKWLENGGQPVPSRGEASLERRGRRASGGEWVWGENNSPAPI